jgi:O-antigen/teichoic acid export membrane protein
MVALSLAAIPLEKILPIITQVSFAAFSRIQADAERVRRNLLRSIQLVSLVCFPAFLGMAAVAEDLIAVVLGMRWLEVILPLQLLCLTLPLRALAALFPPALFGVGRPGINVVNMAISLVVMVIAMLIGVRSGVLGMALAWLIGYPIIFAIITWRSARALGVRFGDLWRQCAFPAAASIAMAAGVLLIRDTVDPVSHPILRLSVLIATGALLYAGMAWTFNRVAIRELITIVRR